MTQWDQEYLSYYRKMVTIRQFETLAGELFAASKIPGFIHLSIGQEASAVGVCSCLRADDYLTTTHRGHGHMIAKGAELKKMVAESIKKTHRVFIVHEACLTGGFGAELTARIQDELFDYLDAPIKRVAAKDFPIPFSPPLEDYVLPKVSEVVDAVRVVTYR